MSNKRHLNTSILQTWIYKPVLLHNVAYMHHKKWKKFSSKLRPALWIHYSCTYALLWDLSQREKNWTSRIKYVLIGCSNIAFSTSSKTSPVHKLSEVKFAVTSVCKMTNFSQQIKVMRTTHFHKTTKDCQKKWHMKACTVIIVPTPWVCSVLSRIIIQIISLIKSELQEYEQTVFVLLNANVR